MIDWAEIERTFGAYFTSTRGRPALPPRLVAGLLYLQHTFDASDEAVVNTWVENPYWQYFCGEVYLQTEAPIDPQQPHALEKAHRRRRRGDLAHGHHRGCTARRHRQGFQRRARHR